MGKVRVFPHMPQTPIFRVANSDLPPHMGLMEDKTHSVIRVFQSFGISNPDSPQANLKELKTLRLEGPNHIESNARVC